MDINPRRPRPDQALIVLGILMVVAVGVALVAVDGSERKQSAGADREGPAAAVNRVVIENFRFDPPRIAVSVGTKITWTNMDAAPHTATSGMSPNPDGVFDTSRIDTDKSGSVTVRKRGRFAYYCAFHPFMKATVTVE